MSRILVAECKQESSSFNPVPSRYEDFSIAAGDDVLARHRGVRSEMAGALSVFDARTDVRVLPAYSARAITSGGELDAAGFDRIAREFLERVRGAGTVDAVYYSLHGAMVAQTRTTRKAISSRRRVRSSARRFPSWSRWICTAS
jgi:microcystin degradation protein MlrC